jgi:hypothetical protein
MEAENLEKLYHRAVKFVSRCLYAYWISLILTIIFINLGSFYGTYYSFFGAYGAIGCIILTDSFVKDWKRRSAKKLQRQVGEI